MVKLNRIIATTTAVVLAFTFATPAQAQFGNILKKAKDAVKEKVKEKATEAKDKAVNKAMNKAADAVNNVTGTDKAADAVGNLTGIDMTAGQTGQSGQPSADMPYLHGSNLSKSGAYSKLTNLYKQNFKPSSRSPTMRACRAASRSRTSRCMPPSSISTRSSFRCSPTTSIPPSTPLGKTGFLPRLPTISI